MKLWSYFAISSWALMLSIFLAYTSLRHLFPITPPQNLILPTSLLDQFESRSWKMIRLLAQDCGFSENVDAEIQFANIAKEVQARMDSMSTGLNDLAKECQLMMGSNNEKLKDQQPKEEPKLRLVA